MGVFCFFLENLLSIFGRFLLIKLGFVGPFRFLLIMCFSLDFPENRSKTHEFIGCLVKTSFSEEINLAQHHNQSRAQPGGGGGGGGEGEMGGIFTTSMYVPSSGSSPTSSLYQCTSSSSLSSWSAFSFPSSVLVAPKRYRSACYHVCERPLILAITIDSEPYRANCGQPKDLFRCRFWIVHAATHANNMQVKRYTFVLRWFSLSFPFLQLASYTAGSTSIQNQSD